MPALIRLFLTWRMPSVPTFVYSKETAHSLRHSMPAIIALSCVAFGNIFHLFSSAAIWDILGCLKNMLATLEKTLPVLLQIGKVLRCSGRMNAWLCQIWPWVCQKRWWPEWNLTHWSVHKLFWSGLVQLTCWSSALHLNVIQGQTFSSKNSMLHGDKSIDQILAPFVVAVQSCHSQAMQMHQEK